MHYNLPNSTKLTKQKIGSFETIFDAIQSSQKKGTPDEKHLANMLTSVLFTYLNKSSLEDNFTKLFSSLKEMLWSDSSAVRSSSSAALAIGSFVAKENNQKQDVELMSGIAKSMQEVIEKSKEDPNLLLMLRSWAVIVTEIPSKLIEESVFTEFASFPSFSFFS